MSRREHATLFIAVFAVALVLLCPLGTALRAFGFDAAGLSARAAGGDVWTGRLREARLGRVAIGDMRVGLKPLPLLLGRAEIGANATIGYGRMIVGPGAIGMADVTAQLPLVGTLAPLPVATLDLAAATIIFADGRCARAEGRVRATFAGEVAGLPLASGLSGTARCERGELVLPLVGQSGLERLIVRVRGNRTWTSVLSVPSNDTALAARLSAAGFVPVPGGQALRLSGVL